MCMLSPATVAAMVDLMNQYQQAGLLIDCRELPDYLPLYLEYLSILPSPTPVKGCRISRRFWR